MPLSWTAGDNSGSSDSQLVFSAKGTEFEGDLGAICKDMVAGKVGYGETTDRRDVSSFL